MIRTLLVLSLILAFMTEGHRRLARRDARLHPRHETLLTLVDRVETPPEAIVEMDIVLPSREEWKYVKKDSIWRIPQYGWAYASGSLAGMVNDLTQCGAVEIPRQSRPDSFFGFSGVRARLYDLEGEAVLETLFGGTLPGLEGRDSYVKMVGRDTIYHIDRNPLGHLGKPSPELPPMIDNKVIPSVLKRKEQLVRIRFVPENRSPARRIERRERPEDEPQSDAPDSSLPPALQDLDLPIYDWFVVLDDREVLVDQRTARDYVHAIESMTFKRLPPAKELSPVEPSFRPELTLSLDYELPRAPSKEGEEEKPPEIFTESIELRGADQQGDRYVYFQGSDLMYVVPKETINSTFSRLVDMINAPRKNQ